MGNRKLLLIVAALIAMLLLSGLSGCPIFGDILTAPSVNEASNGAPGGSPAGDGAPQQPGAQSEAAQQSGADANPDAAASESSNGSNNGNSNGSNNGSSNGSSNGGSDGGSNGSSYKSGFVSASSIGIEPDAEGCADDAAEQEPPSTIVKLTISAAGDVTLGGDPRFNNLFIRDFGLHERDYGAFLRNVSHIFEEDDLTIVNLEGPLTEAVAHLDKGYVFRGPPHFSKILSSSGVDAVTLANNHIKDFHERGYRDTVEALEAEGVSYFGNEFNTIVEINGIKVGLFGSLMWYDGKDNRKRIAAAIEDLRQRGAQLVIAYYHWGEEGSNVPSAYQRTIGRFTIDSGCDLVLGSHPHVIQGIEEYKGKNIVYSLANFCFGGNNNPADKDTIIFQQTFTFDEGALQDTNETNVIPVRVSSDRSRNDFMPTVAEGEDAERILQRLQDYSDKLTKR